ncbi:hypothetical protein PFNF135_00164 [Plasmodium falciparum NF135/5.C10]|uniref:Surface antigen n=1 Tax=Plasmodium falciparum NF135/5.C10 TaxID=1036726 RepID=W4IPA2_PLAFA|nr:hypothetical protein PFNF135_00164 [Plasmodium falciparum NF135/5.C10]
MKLHYSKILLFSLPINILVSSSYAYNKNKPYITKHTPTTTSRLLSECDIHPSIYNNDAEMKSMKEIFNRQTSQRFEEYEERIQEKRQKRKEQRDKNIQKIIEKDKMEKSLAEKVEKGCLRCGCGLGGVAACVGIFGAIAVNELKKAALLAATQAAMTEGTVKGAAMGAAAGAAKFIDGLRTTFSIKQLGSQTLETLFTSTTYTNISDLPYSIYMQYQGSCIPPYTLPSSDKAICSAIPKLGLFQGNVPVETSFRASIGTSVKEILAKSEGVASEVTKTATEEAITTFTKQKTSEIVTTYMGYQTTIIVSIVVILVIVLVMVTTYLILRYRRKKKMNKKLQYAKLLKE